LSGVIRSYSFRYPLDFVNRRIQRVDNSVAKIFNIIEKLFINYSNRITLNYGKLQTYDITGTLKRGFVLVEQNSKFVTRAEEFRQNEKTKLKFFDGIIEIKK